MSHNAINIYSKDVFNLEINYIAGEGLCKTLLVCKIMHANHTNKLQGQFDLCDIITNPIFSASKVWVSSGAFLEAWNFVSKWLSLDF